MPPLHLADLKREQRVPYVRRVREAVRTRGRVTIQPVLPMDILGAYVLLPQNPGVPA